MVARRTRLLGVVGILALGGALAACGGSATGSPTPGPTSSSSAAPPPTSASAAAPSSGATPLASVKPCSLLTKSQAKQLDMVWPGHSTSTPFGGECGWDQDSDTQFAGVGVNFLLDKGIADVRGHGGAISDLTVGSHKARKHSEGGECDVSIGVTPHSRVDVLASDTSGDSDCGLAMRAAKLVEKNLPKS